MRKIVVFSFLAAILFGCNSENKLHQSVGVWKVDMHIGDSMHSVPFFLEIIERNDSLIAAVWNGEEQIVHHSVQVKGDSLIIESPYFNSTMFLEQDGHKMTGYWQDFSRENYAINLSAKYNLSQRFAFRGPLEDFIDGSWEVWFSPNTDNAYKAIGLFHTDDNSMKGTFVTETGDYRFLEGGFGGDQLKLSTFDGSHVFLFEADYKADTLKGMFYSGTHWSEPFIAWRNDTVELQDPYLMSELTNPDEPISLTFNDLYGNKVSIDDEKYQGKALLLQIMGSWCPNCMDEAAYLATKQDWLQENNVELIGLSFERLDYEAAVPPLLKLKESLNINYPILYAGKAKRDSSMLALPWLKAIKSYPTLVMVLPNHKVWRMHTGFYGPGTGAYFTKQSAEMEDDFEKLIQFAKAQ